MQSKVSRRQLIAAGAVGAAVAATTSAAQAASKKPQFDKVYDVIVVGSGFAGLAAALESRLGSAMPTRAMIILSAVAIRRGNWFPRLGCRRSG